MEDWNGEECEEKACFRCGKEGDGDCEAGCFGCEKKGKVKRVVGKLEGKGKKEKRVSGKSVRESLRRILEGR